MTISKEEVINNLSQSLAISRKIIKIGSKIRIHKNAKGTCWEYGYIAEIRDNEALINYGTPQHPIFGMGIKIKLSDLEIMEDLRHCVTKGHLGGK